MRPLLFAVVVCLVAACTNSEQSISPPPATDAVVGEEAAVPIAVEVVFPQSQALVVRDVDGQALNRAGDVVADFVFESGWIIPEDWEWGDPVEKSGAATGVSVELPGPGSYTFRIDPYVLSLRPCGTCETSHAAASITQEVVNGSQVRIPPGSMTAES